MSEKMENTKKMSEKMKNLKKQYENELKNLEVKDDEVINQKMLSKKFKQKAFKVHSDKTGNTGEDKDDEFKKLLDDYHKVSDALKEVQEDEDDGDLRAFFDKHNVSNQCSQSWTILVENEKVLEWRMELKKRYPNPTLVQGCGLQYKASVDGKLVSVTHYENPNDNVSKMNVQGNLDSVKKFVLDILPVIYKNVNDAATKRTKAKLPISTRVKNSTTYPCDECNKTYSSKSGLKSHIKNKHEPQAPDPSEMYMTMTMKTAQMRAEKRAQIIEKMRMILPPISETPIPLHAHLEDDNPPDAKKIGNSEEVLEMSMADSTNDNEESGNKPVVEEAEGEHVDPLQIEENFQCGECGKMFLEDKLLEKHMDDDHSKEIQEKGKVVYLTPECKDCPKAKKDIELAKKMFKTSTESNHEETREKSRQIDNLQRRNEKLNESVDDLKKENKNYSKRVKDLTIENTKLHENAKNDAEAMDDTIRQNFVLQEELKVMKESKDADTLLSDQEVSCKECEWTSKTASHLKGHMLKHSGQYSCQKCKSIFKTREQLEAHNKEKHKQEDSKCAPCGRTFISNVALKQHNLVKHKESLNPPVGHPDRPRSLKARSIVCSECGETFEEEDEIKEHMMSTHQEVNNQGFQTICKHFINGFCRSGKQCKWSHIIQREYHGQSYRCMDCDKEFFNKYQFNKHCKTHSADADLICMICDERFSTRNGMNEHTHEVHGKENNMKPVCRFFRQGRCTRTMCEFRHPVEQNANLQMSHTRFPACRRGQTCHFKLQNRCYYSHPEDETRSHTNSNHRTKPCKYGDECWNISQCTFSHNCSKRVFQSSTTNKVFPNQRVSSVWQDY